EVLINGRGLDWSLTDIAEQADVGWTKLHRIFNSMVKSELVKFTRTIGKAKLYKINEENMLARELIRVFDLITKERNNKILDKIEIIA
ncbi:hypothetical protein HYV88_04505, partial [Candidatus Woesearchaeota archaeon]|nr:hypothetical protein [Candidatus Woesearchaeota archaeon]